MERSLQMKRIILITATMFVTLTVAGLSKGWALTLDFSVVPGANITFVGTSGDDTFFFENSSSTTPSYDFNITASNGTDSDTLGLYGHIDGVYKIGSVFSSLVFGEYLYLAPVYIIPSLSTIEIIDEDGMTFTGGITSWGTIYTLGTSGNINPGGGANIDYISYSGGNSDLQFLKNQCLAGNKPTVTISFQFVPAQTLTQLKDTGAYNSTSYSGTIFVTSTPIPGSVLLLASGLLGLGAVGWPRKRC